MAKGKGQRMRAMRPGPRPDMRQQFQKLQEQLLNTQEALAQETVSVTAGGGAITVVMNGHLRVQSIAIDPDVLSPDDAEMLQDLVMAAVNEAIERAQSLSSERLGALTGGLGNLGGLFGGL